MATDNTVKQSVSEHLARLKFMQRAKIRDDQRKKLGPATIDDSHYVIPGAGRECKVIFEGDPRPEAVTSRMSFRLFNPAVDKLNKEDLTNDSHWVIPGAERECKVIFEGDPRPEAVIGRMSFGNFNPTVDKLNKEALARRKKIRNASTPQASASCIKHGNIEVDDTENISIRKRQKAQQKVEKLTVAKAEATFMKANSFSILRGGTNETDRHHQQRGTKQVNPRTNWRNLWPPSR